MFTDQRNPGVAIGILLTGGSLTLASVLKEAFVVPARAVAGGAKLAARAGRKLSKNVFEFLLKFLRDELPKFIRKLNEPQKLIDEIVEGVRKFLKPAESKSIDTTFDFDDLFRNRSVSKTDGGTILRRSELRNLAKRHEKRDADFDFKVEIITSNSKFRERLKVWNKRNTLGSFNSGPPPTVFVRQRCTKLTLQHELWHFDDFINLGSDAYKQRPTWKHEESGWKKVFDTKEKWSEKELLDSYEYYTEIMYKAGKTPQTFKI